MANGLETDITETWNSFKDLATSEMLNAVKRGMRRSAKAIKQATISNAQSGIKTYNNHNGEYDNGNILDAVRVTGIEDRYDEDEISMKVHVMGYRQPPNKTFRFRFLEKGTKDRYAKYQKGKELKKPRYLGSITPRRFFRQANNSVNVMQIYLEEIQKGIDNVNR